MNCLQTLAGIAAECNTSSMGGIKKVYLTNYDNISRVTLTSNVVTAITMTPNSYFYEYVFPKNTSSLTSTQTIDEANCVNFVTSNLVLQFAKQDATKRVEITALSQGRLAAIVVDANNTYWYLGYDNPVTATAGNGQTGTAPTDGNFYNITLTDVANTYPFTVDASIVPVLLDDGSEV